MARRALANIWTRTISILLLGEKKGKEKKKGEKKKKGTSNRKMQTMFFSASLLRKRKGRGREEMMIKSSITEPYHPFKIFSKKKKERKRRGRIRKWDERNTAACGSMGIQREKGGGKGGGRRKEGEKRG